MGSTSTPRRRTNRAARRPASERRAQILHISIKVFARKGFGEASTAEIAEEIGISEAAVYRYFASKRELYLAALVEASDQILVRWRAMAAESATPLDTLLAIGQWYFSQLEEEPELLMLRARGELDGEDPEIRKRQQVAFLATFDFVHALYASAHRQGLVDASIDLHAQTWLFLALGSLIDRTEFLGLREKLSAEDLGRIIAATAPELLGEKR